MSADQDKNFSPRRSKQIKQKPYQLLNYVKLAKIDIPSSFQETFQIPRWQDAMQFEIE